MVEGLKLSLPAGLSMRYIYCFSHLYAQKLSLSTHCTDVQKSGFCIESLLPKLLWPTVTVFMLNWILLHRNILNFDELKPSSSTSILHQEWPWPIVTFEADIQNGPWWFDSMACQRWPASTTSSQRIGGWICKMSVSSWSSLWLVEHQTLYPLC
jgi:hypothetical protein